MIMKILLLFSTAIIAFWISAICGGGASLILIPALNLFLPTSLVPFSLTIGTFASSASRIVVFKKHVNRKLFLWFVPFALPSVLLGAWLIKYINPDYLQLVVALLLLANIPQLLQSKKKEEQEEKTYSNFAIAIVGFLAGFVSGITGAIGLLFNRFYLKHGLKKEEIIATRAANEILLHVIKIVIYLLLGLYSNGAWLFGLLIALASVISAYTIKYILPHLSEFIFKKIGYGAMVLSGIALSISTSQQIIERDKMQMSLSNKETKIKWRESALAMEFTFDDGLEIERPIKHTELPENLKIKYNKLSQQYDTVLIEKVFQFRKKTVYEFYCYKNKQLTKLEFNEK